MEIQLQELIEQIKKDGVAAAEAEAKTIIDTAKSDAEKIIADAQAQADKIIGDAKKTAVQQIIEEAIQAAEKRETEENAVQENSDAQQ